MLWSPGPSEQEEEKQSEGASRAELRVRRHQVGARGGGAAGAPRAGRDQRLPRQRLRPRRRVRRLAQRGLGRALHRRQGAGGLRRARESRSVPGTPRGDERELRSAPSRVWLGAESWWTGRLFPTSSSPGLSSGFCVVVKRRPASRCPSRSL